MAARVLIVDDHNLVRQGIARLLAEADGIEVVGEAKDGREAIAKARELRPDLILMDLLLPELNGVEATRLIKQEMPQVDVVLLTVSDGEDDVYQALAAGAKGYVLKTTDHAELVQQVKQVASGQLAISAGVAAKLAAVVGRRGGTPPRGQPAHDALTDREREVLAQVGRGARNKEIAATLFISNNTARAHLRSIMRKLGLDNRAQLAAFAVRHNLVESP